jgi:hypothetical protein
MVNAVLDAEIRQRQMSVEKTTIKPISQRQAFVLNMPQEHEKLLGIDVGQLTGLSV